jgi:perosamine synthetase
MIVTDSDEIADRARLMRSHAASVSDLARHNAPGIVIEQYPEAGYNFRMSDLHAAVGLAQLDRLDAQIAARRALAAAYDAAFASLESVRVPGAPEGHFHTYQSYCIVLTDGARLSQPEVMLQLKARGVTTRRGCMAIHAEPYFVQRYGRMVLPVAEELAERSIALPLFASMTPDEQAHVIESVQDVLR